MAKSRDKSELEYLRSLNKALKSENRNLKKQVGRASKKPSRESELEQEIRDLMLEQELEEKEQQEVESKSNCPKCRGELTVTNLGTRTLQICKDCGFRSTKKS